MLFMLWKTVTVLNFRLYIASSALGGIGMAHLIEIPYLKLRERLYPAKYRGGGEVRSLPMISLSLRSVHEAAHSKWLGGRR
jgi:hypothetical protein